jgi:ATP-dependent DNA helicase DinG
MTHPTSAPADAPAETTPNEAEHAYIEHAYRQLAALPGFVSRPEQLALSHALADAWLANVPLAAQAPTGTGKTVAYLVAGLAVRRNRDAMGLPLPLVVATATKALQAQLLATDVGWLARAGLLETSTVALAKGKSNYLCVRDAHDVSTAARQAAVDPEVYISDDDEEFVDAALAAELLAAFNEGRWDGDFDTFPGAKPKSARMFAVNGETCTGRKCPHFAQCAYYRARSLVERADVVVTNQDLLLSNLALQAAGTEPLLKGAYLLLVDEAHHLPQKAIAVGARELALTRLTHELSRIAPAMRGLLADEALARLFASRRVDETALAAALRTLETELAEIGVDADSGAHRFRRGALPETLIAALTTVYTGALRLFGELQGIFSELKTLGTDAMFAKSRTRIGETFRRLAPVVAELEASVRACSALAGPSASVKWSSRNGTAWFLHYSPLEGAQVLEPLLWENKAIRTCLVSATLQDTSGFERYRKRVGLPAAGRTHAMPYVLPYERSRLVVAAMRYTPKQGEREKFLAELHEQLPQAIDGSRATLVLFPSWTMLRALAPTLHEHFGTEHVRVQGEMPVKLLVAAHCRDVDAGHGAVLAGVASMSEGMDLPGKYCEHVCVVSLPFAVPTGPLEEEVAELLGSRYFAERSLPDATMRLIQMCGRLVRRETDVGTITVFDRRLAAMQYGRQMLKALPPFTQVIEPLTAPA